MRNNILKCLHIIFFLSSSISVNCAFYDIVVDYKMFKKRENVLGLYVHIGYCLAFKIYFKNKLHKDVYQRDMQEKQHLVENGP